MLELQSVSVKYGSIQALKDISLKVTEGEVVTLIGANGAGKTTILKTISGLLRPSKGRILYSVEGVTHDLGKTRPARIVSLGVCHVPEGRRIFPKMTVLENLQMGAYQRRRKSEVEQDMERAFSYFPILKARAKQLGGTLSGGEQQMLAIARGLLSKPRLLLLDEPSLGLAPTLVEQIFSIIKSVHQEGVTVLLVEQNAYLALEIAQRGYVLETGKVVMEGSSSMLIEDNHIRRAYLGGNRENRGEKVVP